MRRLPVALTVIYLRARTKAERLLAQSEREEKLALDIVEYMQKTGRMPTKKVIQGLVQNHSKPQTAPKGWEAFVGGMPTSVGSPAGTGN